MGEGFEIGFGARTLPPTRMGALLFATAVGTGTFARAVPEIIPPITPPSWPPGTPPGTPPATPIAMSGSIGASLIIAIFCGITVGAMSFPAFTKTCFGATLFTIFCGAGGGGGGGGGATSIVTANCFKLIASVK